MQILTRKIPNASLSISHLTQTSTKPPMPPEAKCAANCQSATSDYDHFYMSNSFESEVRHTLAEIIGVITLFS